jgi:hypothetical protein
MAMALVYVIANLLELNWRPAGITRQNGRPGFSELLKGGDQRGDRRFIPIPAWRRSPQFFVWVHTPDSSSRFPVW